MEHKLPATLASMPPREERVTWSSAADHLLAEIAIPQLMVRKSGPWKVRDVWRCVHDLIQDKLRAAHNNLGMRKTHLLTPTACRNRLTKLMVHHRQCLKTNGFDPTTLDGMDKLLHEYHEFMCGKNKEIYFYQPPEALIEHHSNNQTHLSTPLDALCPDELLAPILFHDQALQVQIPQRTTSSTQYIQESRSMNMSEAMLLFSDFDIECMDNTSQELFQSQPQLFETPFALRAQVQQLKRRIDDMDGQVDHPDKPSFNSLR